MMKMLAPALLDWFASSARDLPWRRTLDPYAIWISEIMLQQTQVKTVIPYWLRWMDILPDAPSLARARPEQVLKLWEGLGYYTRARHLQKAAQQILDRHEGVFPRQFSDVLALPGIGRYTAGAICSIAFNTPAPILDGNVIRVLTRVFGIEGDPREKGVNERLWQLAESGVCQAAREGSPGESPSARISFPLSGPCSAFNQATMELGALVCTPRQPRCTECPLTTICRAHADRRTDELPNLPPRTKPTERRFVAFAVQLRGRWLVHRRPAGSVNAHLWEFPSFELVGKKQTPAPGLFARQFGARPTRLTPLPVIRHSITRYRMVLTPFHASLARRPIKAAAKYVWRTPAEIEALALTSAHRKLWRHIQSR